MMKQTLFFAALALMLTACGGPKAETAQIPQMNVTEFLSKAGEFAGQEVALEGTVTHVCKHGGKKMFIVGSDGTSQLKITASGDIGSFDLALEGSPVVVNGTVEELVVNEEYLCSMEAEITAEDDHDHSDNSASQEQVDNLRKQVEDSGQDHLAFYSLAGTSCKVISGEEN